MLNTRTRNWKANTGFFLTSQAVSLLGSSLVQYAILWHITLTTQSGIMATLATVCGFLPTLILAPFAGVWADRYNRKRLIILADGSIALFTAILALCWMLGVQEIWLLLAVMSVRALGSAVQQPAVSAMLPDIAPGEQLTRVNGIHTSVTAVIALVSPMLGGLLMGLIPLAAIFFVDVGTAAVGIAVMILGLSLPQKEKKQKPVRGAYFSEMKGGFSYIRQHAYLRSFFLFLSFVYFLIGPVSFLTPLQVARTFGSDVWRLSLIEVIFSVGMLLGGVLITVWGGFKNKVHTVGIAILLNAVCIIALGLPLPFWGYCAAMAAIGLFIPAMNAPSSVLLQQKVDADYLGRVFSVMTILSSCLMPLSMLLFGPLADIVSIEILLLISGAVLAVVSLLMLKSKPLLAAGAALPPSDAPEEPPAEEPHG